MVLPGRFLSPDNILPLRMNICTYRVKPFVEWIKQNKFHGFIGEYGIPDNDPRWNETLDLFLGYLQENGINGTYWAAGPWWDTYFMAITPKDGKDRPQMPIIEKYTSTFKK